MSPTLITRVSDASGRTFELGSLDAVGLAVAFQRASRVAKLLGLIGDPQRWRGGRVSVHRHGDDPQPALLYAWRVRVAAAKAVSRV